MTPVRPGGALARLARSYGIQMAYKSAGGLRVVASAESLMGALRALGVDIDSPGKAGEALRQRDADATRAPVPPVTVVWQGDPAPVVRVYTTTVSPGSWSRAVIELEDGGERPVRLEVPSGRVVARYGRGSSAPPDRGDTIACLLPADLPPGYHRLRLDSPGVSGDTLLIVAPERAYRASAPPSNPASNLAGRPWGVFLPLYSLVTQRTWAAADYSDLDAAVQWASNRGAAAFGTLPLLPASLDVPFDPSPYAPVSRIFWNEFYVDPRATPEFEICAPARQAFEKLSRQADALRKDRVVDYRTIWDLKRAVFEQLAACSRRNQALADRTDRFTGRNPEVGEYAAFRAACEYRQRVWREWPERMRKGRLTRGDYDPGVAAMYAFLQRAAAEQLANVGRHKAEAGTGLYLDLPVGVSSDGFDVWNKRELFANGASAGAPPDLFFSRGQNWGFAPLNPDRIRADRYRHWRLVLRHHMQFATMLRIDHVMGLHRMFFVPDGMEPTEGVYVRSPTEELYAAVTLESQRARTVVVGEDLGTVPRHVGPMMRHRGLRQMYAAYFQVDPDGDPPVETPTRHMVAFVNTHDMATFGAYWSGKDTELRRRLGVVDAKQARAEAREKRRLKRAISGYLRRKHLLDGGDEDAAAALRALLRFLAASPAVFLLVSMEDLWLEESPQNVPGTTDEHPNWRQRAKYRIEEWDQVPGVRDVLAEIAQLRSRRPPSA